MEVTEPPSFQLWEWLRDVNVWGACDVHVRQTLFRGEMRPLPHLGDPKSDRVLGALQVVSGDWRNPDPEDFADACRELQLWADERAYLESSALFAEAAALLSPRAELANIAGWMCRRNGWSARAGIWFERAYGLAVREGNRQQQIRARLGYGRLMYTLGRYDLARKFISKASTKATNTNRARQAAEAEHEMLAIASELRQLARGEKHALKALNSYPIHHPRLPFLVHDIAYLLTVCCFYSFALPLLRLSIRAMQRPQDPVLAWSTTARAAAGAGRLDEYLAARDNTVRLARSYPEMSPNAYMNLAFAGQLTAAWEEAREAAERGLAAAIERNEPTVEVTCRRLLAEIAQRGPGAPEAEPPADTHLEEIVRECIIRMRRWSGPHRGRPHGKSPPA